MKHKQMLGVEVLNLHESKHEAKFHYRPKTKPIFIGTAILWAQRGLSLALTIFPPEPQCLSDSDHKTLPKP